MNLNHNQYAVAAIAATLCLAGIYTIIGAGLSGLSCAHYLDKSKYNIKILESNSVAGGRAKSEIIDEYICDVGFQVLLNNYDEIKKLNLYHKLDLKYFDSGASIYQDGKIWNKLINLVFMLSLNLKILLIGHIIGEKRMDLTEW